MLTNLLGQLFDIEFELVFITLQRVRHMRHQRTAPGRRLVAVVTDVQQNDADVATLVIRNAIGAIWQHVYV